MDLAFDAQDGLNASVTLPKTWRKVLVRAFAAVFCENIPGQSVSILPQNMRISESHKEMVLAVTRRLRQDGQAGIQQVTDRLLTAAASILAGSCAATSTAIDV